MEDTFVGVYKIPCRDCKLSYIGETGKSLKIKMKQQECNYSHNSNFVVNHHKLKHFIDFKDSCAI